MILTLENWLLFIDQNLKIKVLRIVVIPENCLPYTDARSKSEMVSSVVFDYSSFTSFHLSAWHSSHSSEEQNDFHGEVSQL